MIRIFTDGLCKPVNPGGTACYGYVVYRGTERIKEGYGLAADGPEASNNVAEYRAIISALMWLIEYNYADNAIEVCSDSQLAIRQINGQYSVGAPRIIPLYNEVLNLKHLFRKIKFTWIPREKNVEADGLSRVAYREHREMEKIIDWFANKQLNERFS